MAEQAYKNTDKEIWRELAALAPHYIHKDKVKAVRDYVIAEGAKGYGLDSERIADELTALLGKEGE